MAFWLLWAPAGLVGCLGGAPLDLPTVEGAQTLVFVAETVPERTVRVTDLDPGPLAISDAPVTLLYYPFDRDSLGLGPMGSLSGMASETQSLPPPLRAFEMRRDGSIEWMSIRPEDAPHASIRVPRPDYVACIDERGGCISQDAPWRCLRACPQATPREPALPDMPCPPGWSATTVQTADVQVCEPPLQDLRRCPEGEYQGGPGLPCAPLSGCESGPWPTPPSGLGPVRYVAAGGSAGGDGSMAQPWTSLEQAIEDAPDGATLLLSEGTHTGGAEFADKTMRIQGLCAQRTEIAGGLADALTATDATLTLSALKLSSQGQALVAMGGALTLEGVSLAGQGPLLFAQRSQLRAERLRTRDSSGGGLLIGEDSDVQLQAWDHAGGAGLSMHTGRLSIVGGTVRSAADARTVAIELQSVSTSTLADIQVDGAPTTAAVEVYGLFRSVVMQDAILRSGSGLGVQVGPEARALDPVSQTDLTRVYAEAVSGKAVIIRGGRFSADFLTARALDDSAIDLRHEGPWASEAVIDHLWASGLGSVVVELRQSPDVPGTAIAVHGEDWVLESDEGADAFFTVSVSDEASLTLRRAWIRGERGSAIDARCGDLDLEDLTIINGEDRGITAQAPAIFRVHRAHFEGPTATALESTVFTARCSGTAPAKVSSVRFEGCAECPAAVTVQSGAQLQLTDVLIEGFDIGGLAGGTGRLEVTSSEVRDGRLGFQLSDPAQVDGVVRGVRFDVGNSVTIAAP